MTYHSHDIVFVEFFDGTYQVVIDFAYISSSGDKHYSGTLISGSERTFSERQIVQRLTPQPDSVTFPLGETKCSRPSLSSTLRF